MLVSLLFLGAFAIRYSYFLMLGDNFNYVAYWENIFQNASWSTELQTPKPIPILVFGALHELTGGFDFLPPLFILVGVLTIYASMSIVQNVAGPYAAAPTLSLILLNTAFVAAVVSGASELLCSAVLLWLIARHATQRLPDRVTAAGLFAANLIRPESWLFSLGAAVVTWAYLLRSGRETASLPRSRERALVAVTVPLLAPALWLAFDFFAFGDPLYSFHATLHFADISGATGGADRLRDWSEYPADVLRVVRIVVIPSVLALSVLGTLATVRRNPATLVLLALLSIATLATYLQAYSAGLVLFDRFFLSVSLVALVLAAIGWVHAFNWLWVAAQRFTPSPGLASARHLARAIVILTMSAVLLVPLRGAPAALAAAVAGSDAVKQWRLSAAEAAQAVRRDTDYSRSSLVVVGVGNEVLTGRALDGNHGENLVDLNSWIFHGAAVAPTSTNVYVIHDARRDGDPGEVVARLKANDFQGRHVTIIFENEDDTVYKLD